MGHGGGVAEGLWCVANAPQPAQRQRIDGRPELRARDVAHFLGLPPRRAERSASLTWRTPRIQLTPCTVTLKTSYFTNLCGNIRLYDITRY